MIGWQTNGNSLGVQLRREKGVMGMNLVRTTYWLGAIIDLLAGIQLLLPESVTLLGFEGLRSPGPAGLPAVTAAILMFGFTAILLWAQLRPVERRVVLLITLAVIVLLALVNVVSGLADVQPWCRLLPPLGIQAVLGVLFAASYVIAARSSRFYAGR